MNRLGLGFQKKIVIVSDFNQKSQTNLEFDFKSLRWNQLNRARTYSKILKSIKRAMILFENGRNQSIIYWFNWLFLWISTDLLIDIFNAIFDLLIGLSNKNVQNQTKLTKRSKNGSKLIGFLHLNPILMLEIKSAIKLG